MTLPALAIGPAVPRPDPPLVLNHSTDSRPPGTPYGTDQNGQPKSPQQLRKELDVAFVAASQSGDLAKLNTIDNFRQTLTPQLQAEYDRQLQTLRNDPRITFEGAQRDPAMEDMILRGMLSATFGNPRQLDATLQRIADESGHLVITSTSDDIIAVSSGNTTRYNTAAMKERLAIGDDPGMHEFIHHIQHGPDYPADFPFAQAMDAELARLNTAVANGEKQLAPYPGDGDATYNWDAPHKYTGVMNRFHLYPEVLHKDSPALYQMMVEYTGYDPLTQQSRTPVQLNGTGDIASSTATLQHYFGNMSSDGRFITRDDLQALLDKPELSMPSDVRAAAAFLLSSPASRHLLDTGYSGAGNVDGRIGLGDLQQAAETIRSGDYIHELLDTGAGRGSRDHYISPQDIHAVLSDPGIAPEIRAGIQILLVQNPQAWTAGLRY